MVKLANTLDLGSSASAWGFKSLHPHHKLEKQGKSLFFLFMERKNALIFQVCQANFFADDFVFVINNSSRFA